MTSGNPLIFNKSKESLDFPCNPLTCKLNDQELHGNDSCPYSPTARRRWWQWRKNHHFQKHIIKSFSCEMERVPQSCLFLSLLFLISFLRSPLIFLLLYFTQLVTISPQDSLGQSSFVGHVFELTQTSTSSSSLGLKRFLVRVGEKKQEQTATLASPLSLSCDGGCSCVWEGLVKEEDRGEGGGKEKRDRRWGW